MRTRWTTTAAAAILFTLATASSSAAQYSMAGKWGIEPQSSFNLDLQQAGGVLSWAPSGTPVGTIDESTGQFSLNLGYPSYPSCGQLLIEGVVALDSLSFTGSLSSGTIAGPTPHFAHCEYGSQPIVGSRCGNAAADAGEACEDDNGRNGDCCSSTCQFEAAGSACTSDDEECTADTCDAAGTCLHTSIAGPCSVGCMDGTCSDGECAAVAPSATGTACDDYDYCTVDDTCDGAGACAGGEPRDCGPCGVCDWTGCRSPVPCDEAEAPTRASSLKMSTGDQPEQRRLVMRLRDIVPDEELGDPTTDTSYTVCLAGRDDSFLAIPRPLMSFELPAGGMCGTSECWKRKASGFAYKNKATTTDGVESFGAGEGGFRLKGKGASLPFDDGMPVGTLLVQVLSNDGVTTRCRMAEITQSTGSSEEYKGAYKP